MNFRLRIIGIFLAVVMVIASCENSEDPANMSEPANVQFKLIDNPANYKAVLIDVQGLEYKPDTAGEDDPEEDEGDDDSEDENESDSRIADDDDEGAWHTVEIEPMVYDLLELNNGAEALLADVDIEPGELKEVRLILGSGNKLVTDEEDTIDLTVPSGAESGLKVKVDADIEPGEAYEVVIDFDAAKSVVKAGKSGMYLLKPVIRVSIVGEDDEGDFGGISGAILPDTISAVIWVINDDDDSVSTMTEGDGSFLIEMLEEDTYSVVAVPEEDSGYDNITVDPVEVLEGEITKLDTIRFEE